MHFLNLFTRPRYKAPLHQGAPFSHIKGDVIGPGVEVFSYESTVSDPSYVTKVFPQWNFQTLPVYQHAMAFQVLSIPANPLAGMPFGETSNNSLIEATQYPNVNDPFYG